MTARTTKTASGLTMAYDVQGSGPVVVLLPGVLMERSRWHATGYVEQLQQHHRVIAIDPLGHGESEKSHDPADYSQDQLVEHTLAVLDAEAVETASVWGFSRGGSIAARVGWAVPERVSSLVLGSTPMTGGSSWPEPALDAMSRADWPTFWDNFIPVPDSVRQYMEEVNDPRAIAAAIIGGSGAMEWRPFECPTIGYVGDDEGFEDVNRRVGGEIGVPIAILPTGSHAATFDSASAVLPVVEPFL